MNGLEAEKLIRREEERHGRPRPRGAKVIVTAAAGDADSINTVFRQLCDAYLVKPIDGAELLNGELSASLHDVACPELITSVLRPPRAMEADYGWQSTS